MKHAIDRIVQAARDLVRSPNDIEVRTAFLRATFNLDRTAAVLALLDALSSERAAREDAEGERDAALREMSKYAREAGEAIGKLETSELAGIVEGWKDRALAAEAQVSALQAQVDGLRDVGVLQEALERAWKDCGAMAPHPSPAAINIIGRHMAHHIPEVVREFSQPPADEANGA